METLRLKELLNEKGISGKDLADKVGVTPASISNIVQNNSFPKPVLLHKIAEVLDVDIKELFNATKADNGPEMETLYIKRDETFVSIGSLNIRGLGK